MRQRLARIVIALVLVGCASVETGPARDVAGRWSGQCFDCPVRSFTLVLAQGGDQLTGTLQASGRTGPDEAAMPLLEGKVAGRRVTFRTRGADGVPFFADLTVSDDGQAMDAQGRHRAAFGLKFIRASR